MDRPQHRRRRQPRRQHPQRSPLPSIWSCDYNAAFVTAANSGGFEGNHAMVARGAVSQDISYNSMCLCRYEVLVEFTFIRGGVYARVDHQFPFFLLGSSVQKGSLPAPPLGFPGPPVIFWRFRQDLLSSSYARVLRGRGKKDIPPPQRQMMIS